MRTATVTSPREIGAALVPVDFPVEVPVDVDAGVLPIVFGGFLLLLPPLKTVRTRTRTTTTTARTPPTIISVVRSGD